MIGLVFFCPLLHTIGFLAFVLDSGEAVHFLPQPGTNSVIGRNAGVHIDFLVYRLVEGVISWVD